MAAAVTEEFGTPYARVFGGVAKSDDVVARTFWNSTSGAHLDEWPATETLHASVAVTPDQPFAVGVIVRLPPDYPSVFSDMQRVAILTGDFSGDVRALSDVRVHADGLAHATRHAAAPQDTTALPHVAAQHVGLVPATGFASGAHRKCVSSLGVALTHRIVAVAHAATTRVLAGCGTHARKALPGDVEYVWTCAIGAQRCGHHASCGTQVLHSRPHLRCRYTSPTAFNVCHFEGRVECGGWICCRFREVGSHAHAARV